MFSVTRKLRPNLHAIENPQRRQHIDPNAPDDEQSGQGQRVFHQMPRLNVDRGQIAFHRRRRRANRRTKACRPHFGPTANRCFTWALAIFRRLTRIQRRRNERSRIKPEQEIDRKHHPRGELLAGVVIARHGHAGQRERQQHGGGIPEISRAVHPAAAPGGEKIAEHAARWAAASVRRKSRKTTSRRRSRSVPANRSNARFPAHAAWPRGRPAARPRR